MKLNCTSILVTQRYENGVLAGPHHEEFSINNKINVIVDQVLVRKVRITSNVKTPIIELMDFFNILDKLIMLFDGVFIPVKSIAVYNGDEDITGLPEVQDIINQRIIFTSNNIFVNNSKFCNWDCFIDENILIKWKKLLDELEIVHQVVLFNSGELKYPIDGKVANLIEVSESLVDIVKLCTGKFNNLHPGEKGTTLRNCIDSLISEYGKDIFAKEYLIKKDAFLSILTKSRVRIMHIKRKYPKLFFDGKESLVYLAKFTFLYRHVLLQLLGIDYEMYKTQLTKLISQLDSFNGIVDNLLKRI